MTQRHKIENLNCTSGPAVGQTVNTVCLGFSYEFIEFSQSWFYRWFLAKITDFGGEDEGFLAKIRFLAKITNFLAKITDFLAKITDFFIFANVYCAY